MTAYIEQGIVSAQQMQLSNTVVSCCHFQTAEAINEQLFMFYEKFDFRHRESSINP